MATGRSTKLTGAVGEFLVAAELCRRNMIATPFAGNVPHYDIIASGQFGGHVVIQVKAINGGAWQFDIRKFVHIDREGPRQIPGALECEPYPGLVCVLVLLERLGSDRFFILRWTDLQAIVVPSYTEYLSKHGGVRPKAADSVHTAVSVQDVEQFESEWDSILERVPKEAGTDSSADAAVC
jgi:hypothetical protein